MTEVFLAVKVFCYLVFVGACWFAVAFISQKRGSGLNGMYGVNQPLPPASTVTLSSIEMMRQRVATAETPTDALDESKESKGQGK